MGLSYVGPTITADREVSIRDYVDQVLATGFTTTQVDSALASAFSGYANKSYADSQDALNATQAYVDAGDAGRLALAQKDVASGIAALQSNGKISPARLNVPNGQRLPHGPWSPTAYQSSVVLGQTAEVNIYSCPITDPGYTYRLLVFGELEVISGIDTQWADVVVRVGNATTGPIIAKGSGVAENYGNASIDAFNRTAPSDLNGVGGTFWTQSGSTPNIVINSSGEAYYNGSGGSSRLAVRDSSQPDYITSGDYQVVGMTIGGTVNTGHGFGSQAANILLGRVNAAATEYVTGIITDNSAILGYQTTGGQGQFASVSMGAAATGDLFLLYCGDVGTATPRKFTLTRTRSGTTTTIASATESGTTSKLDSSHRTWGFSYLVGAFGALTVNPSTVDAVSIADPTQPNATASSPANIEPLNPASQSTRTGATTLYVNLVPSGAAGVGDGLFAPRLFPLVVPQ